jgi:hypothetical protein
MDMLPIYEAALSTAQQHLDGIHGLPGTRWVVAAGKRVEGGGFFAYRVDRSRLGSGFGCTTVCTGGCTC